MPNIKLQFTDMQTILFNDYKISISGTPLYDYIIEKSCFIALQQSNIPPSVFKIQFLCPVICHNKV